MWASVSIGSSMKKTSAFACAALALVAFVGAGPDDRVVPRPPDGTYAYAITLGGRPIGTSSIVVAAAGRTIKSSQTFTRTALGPMSATSTIVYDPRVLRQISYTSDLKSSSGDVVHLSVGNAGGSVDISQGKNPAVNVGALKNAPLLVIDDDLGPSDLFLPAMLRASNAKVASLIFVRTGKNTLLRVVADDTAPRPASVPASDASITLEYQSEIVIHEVLWYDPATFVLHALVVPGSGVEIKLTGFVPAA